MFATKSFSLWPASNNLLFLTINCQHDASTVFERVSFPDHKIRIFLCFLESKNIVNLCRDQINGFLG